MNETEADGTVQDVVGHVKDAAGGLTGDTGTQAEGKLDQLQGTFKQEYGEAAEDIIGSAQDGVEVVTDLVRDNPLTALGIAAGVGFLLGYILVPSRR